MRKDYYRSQFRLPHPLYDKLKGAADANERSLNAELVYRLEQSFSDTTSADAKSLKGALREDYLRLARGLLHELGVDPKR